MEVAAAKATLLPKLGRPRMKLKVHASQTAKEIMIRTPRESWDFRKREGEGNLPVLTGDFHCGLTFAKNLCPGMPPSLANAYIILEFEVIENVLYKPNNSDQIVYVRD